MGVRVFADDAEHHLVGAAADRHQTPAAVANRDFKRLLLTHHEFIAQRANWSIAIDGTGVG
jgi:hypothetical protein